MPHGDRGGVPVEPLLTTQWYCNAGELAKPAIEAVETRRDRVRAEAMGEHVLRLDARHPALVHLAASSGGAIASRPGTAPDGTVFVATHRGGGAGGRRAQLTGATIR